MKSLFKILLSLLLYISAQAQTYFNKNYDYFVYQNYAVRHLILPDSTIFLPTTYSDQNNTGNINYLFINNYGDTIFSKGISIPNTYLGLTSASPKYDASDSSIILTCISVDTTNNANAFVLKLSLDGDTIWTRTFGGVGYDIIHTILIDTSGYFLIGSTNSFGAGSFDVLLLKIDTNGTLIQQYAIGNPTSNQALSACFSNDGNIIVTGSENYDDLLWKIDKNGGIIWQQFYPAGTGQCFVSTDDSSNYYMASSFINQFNIENLLIRKVDSLGQQIWQKTLNSNTYSSASLSPLIIATDNRMYLSTSQSLLGIVTGSLWCFSPTGDSLWSAQYTSTPGLDAYFYHLSPFPGGGFLMSGFADTPNQYNNAWLVRVDSNGCLVPGCPNSVEEYALETERRMLISPNPANDIVSIEFKEQPTAGTIFIYNAAGALVLSQLYTPTINISHFAEGLYFINFLSSDGSSMNGKLVISR